MKKWLETDSFEEAFEKFNDNMGEVDTKLSEKVQNFKIKNEVVNGDFSDGSTGWQFTNSIGSVVDGVAKFIATSTSGRIETDNLNDISVISGERYYLRAKVKSSTNLMRLYLQQGVSPYTYVGSDIRTHTGSGNYEIMSGIIIAQSSLSNVKVRIADTRTSEWTENEVDDVSLINVTATFGAGNEPTKEQMDELMKVIPNQWWDGELTLEQKEVVQWLLKLEAEKANKQQEAWITPTLLNGWENVASTTPIGYYKDTLGVVHFRGALKGGVDNTDAFILPVGYRPSTNIRSIGSTSDNTVGRYNIDTLGNVRPYKGSSTYVYAVNVSFRAKV